MVTAVRSTKTGSLMPTSTCMFLRAVWDKLPKNVFKKYDEIHSGNFNAFEN